MWELPCLRQRMKGTFCTWDLFKGTLVWFLLFISTYFVICCLEQSSRWLKNFVKILLICHTCYIHCPSQHAWQHSPDNIPRSVHTMTVHVGNFSTDSCWEILYVVVRFLPSALLTVATPVLLLLWQLCYDFIILSVYCLFQFMYLVSVFLQALLRVIWSYASSLTMSSLYPPLWSMYTTFGPIISPLFVTYSAV